MSNELVKEWFLSTIHERNIGFKIKDLWDYNIPDKISIIGDEIIFTHTYVFKYNISEIKENIENEIKKSLRNSGLSEIQSTMIYDSVFSDIAERDLKIKKLLK